MKNKKGMTGIGYNFIFGLVGVFILILVLTVLVPIQKNGFETGREMEILNKVENRILTEDFKISEENGVVVNVVYSFIQFVLYSSFEITKAAIKYSIAHPNFVNAQTLLIIILISLFMPIIWYLFLFIVVIVMLVREYVLKKKENKVINESKKV